MSDKDKQTTLWDKLEFPIVDDIEGAKTPSKPDKSRDSTKRKRKAYGIAGTILGLVFWLYLVVNTIFFNLDNLIQSVLPGELAFLVTYKFFVFLGILVLTAVFLKRYFALVLYVIFFPGILMFWKIPRLLYRYKSWVVVLTIFDAIASLFGNFKKKILLGGVTIFTMLFVLILDNPMILAALAVILAAVLLYTLISTIVRSFSVSSFFTQQKRGIDWLLKKQVLTKVGLLDDKLKKKDIQKYTTEQTSQIINAIQLSLIGQRLIYFWAYQLEKYSKSNSAYLLNTLSYIWLFIKLIVFVTFINLAIYKIDPTQFIVRDGFGFLTALDYSLNAFVLNETSRALADGSIALITRIASEITGFLVLGSLLLNLYAARIQKNNTDLQHAVDEIKSQGRAMEKRFAQEFELTPEQAIGKLSDLRNTMLKIINWITKQFPDDYLR
jgi:hypothetical protein